MTTPDTSPPIPPLPPGLRPPRRRLRFLPRTWRGWLLTFFSVVLLVLLGTWLLSRSAPPWYQPLDASDQRVIDLSDRGQAILLDLHNKVQRVPTGEQTWTISQDELNSYIAIQFARGLDTRGNGAPPLVSAPLVLFSPGRVTVSARTTRLPSPNKDGGVGSLVFDVGTVPSTDGKTMGLVKLTGVWAGCLPVPRSVVDTRLRAMVPTITAAIQQAAQTQFNLRESSQWSREADEVVHKASAGEPFPLEFKVDRKQLVIRAIRVEEGRFTLVMGPPLPSAPLPAPAQSPR
jgi:hypothetical protein